METAPSPKAPSALPTPDSAPWRGAVWRSLEIQAPMPSSSSRPSSVPHASRDRTSMRQWRPFLPMGFLWWGIPRPLSYQWGSLQEVGLHLQGHFRVARASLRTLTGRGASPSREDDLGSMSTALGNPDFPPANLPSEGALRAIKLSLEKTTASPVTTFWKGPSCLQRPLR